MNSLRLTTPPTRIVECRSLTPRGCMSASGNYCSASKVQLTSAAGRSRPNCAVRVMSGFWVIPAMPADPRRDSLQGRGTGLCERQDGHFISVRPSAVPLEKLERGQGGTRCFHMGAGNERLTNKI